LPVGSVAVFAGQVTGQSKGAKDCHVTQVERHGWMVCDGRQLHRARFPELFAAIGYRYLKAGEAPGPLFRIPDLQGYFLRGVDPGGKIDPDTAVRTMPDGEPASSPRVGSIQASAFRLHEHDYQQADATSVISQVEGIGASLVKPTTQPTSKVVAEGEEKEDPKSFTSAKETRPINVAVYYIIKFRGQPRGARWI
jgi:microcystin-dependent protein